MDQKGIDKPSIKYKKVSKGINKLCEKYYIKIL
jgi:hypothetical protein